MIGFEASITIPSYYCSVHVSVIRVESWSRFVSYH